MHSRPCLVSPGTVTIEPDGKVIIADFFTEDASCRESVQVAIAWAMQQLGRALADSLGSEYPSRSAVG